VLPVERTMDELSDHDLLRVYVERGTDEAFAELVGRHGGLVWGVALRMSRSRESAADVSQAVFIDLARKAGSLPKGTILEGWLHRAACHAAAKHVRQEARRARRESESMRDWEEHPSDPNQNEVVGHLQPFLDAAMGDLSQADRDVIAIRYLSGRSYPEICSQLGASEAAVQKRVSRALERLREAFRRRGVDVSMGTMAAAMSLAGATTVPAGLLSAMTSAACTSAQAAPLLPKLLFLMKYKIATGLLGGAVLSTLLYLQEQRVRRLVSENAALRQQAEALRSPEATLDGDRPDLAAESEASARDKAELLRLRGEIARLRQQSSGTNGAEPPTASAASPEPAGSNGEPDATTPSGALERLVIASRTGDPSSIGALVAWRIGEGVSEETLQQLQQPMIRNLTNAILNSEALRILNSITNEHGLVRSRVEWRDGSGAANHAELLFTREANAWRPVFEVTRSPSGAVGASFFVPPTQALDPDEK